MNPLTSAGRKPWLIIPLACVAIGLTACTPVTETPTTVQTPVHSPPPPEFLPARPSATEPVVPTASSTPNLKPAYVILAKNLTEPDDLFTAPDGSIYLSDVTAGTVSQYTQAGGLQVILSGLSAPEGMVMLPDGSLIIAEQGRNRLMRYQPATKALSLLLTLDNTTGMAGVDGLAFDSKSQTIIVPDSPNGTVLRVSSDGSTVRKIASGFARPTGAWVEANGDILVVDENGNSLSRIKTDGTVEKLADLHIPDDVLEDEQGNILVNTLGDGAIHLLAAGTLQHTVLLQGLSDPQGMAFDSDGNLLVTDAGHHRLIKLILH